MDAMLAARKKRTKGLSKKEVCRRARAGRWGHEIGNHNPNGKRHNAES